MKSPTHMPPSPTDSRVSWRPVVLVLVVGGLLILSRHPGLREFLNRLLEWVNNAGPVGVIVFTLAYILTCMLMFPAVALSLGAGLIWGTLKGTLAVSFASTLGACMAFLVSRYLMRAWIIRKTEGNPRLHALHVATQALGWKIVFLTRLSPVFPFVFLNYAFGLTGVSFRGYAIASWIGMLPGTVMYVYLGSLGRAAVSEPPTLAGWLLRTIGIAATVAITVFAARAARTALRNVHID